MKFHFTGDGALVVSGSVDELNALARAMESLGKARAKFQPMNSAHEGYSVMREELDELQEELQRARIKFEVEGWQAVKADDFNATMSEASHVAAMGLRFLIDVPRCAGTIWKEPEPRTMADRVMRTIAASETRVGETGQPDKDGWMNIESKMPYRQEIERQAVRIAELEQQLSMARQANSNYNDSVNTMAGRTLELAAENLRLQKQLDDLADRRTLVINMNVDGRKVAEQTVTTYREKRKGPLTRRDERQPYNSGGGLRRRKQFRRSDDWTRYENRGSDAAGRYGESC